MKHSLTEIIEAAKLVGVYQQRLETTSTDGVWLRRRLDEAKKDLLALEENFLFLHAGE